MRNYIAVILLFSVQCIGAVELSNAILTDGQLAGISESQRKELIKVSDVLESQNIDVNSSIAITNLGLGSVWYMLSEGKKIYAANAEVKQYLGGWKLDPYKDHLILSGEYLAAAEVMAVDQGVEFSKPSDPFSIIQTRTPAYTIFGEAEKNTIGCFENAPLRYGDINGQPELVLMLGKNLIIFSAGLKKVTFSMHYYQDDEWPLDEVEAEGIEHDQPKDPQYLAGSTYDALRIGKGGLFPAWRSLGKIYVGNFSSENAKDILLWRKLYESRLVEDSVEGFKTLGNLYVHYQLVNGEYRRQATASNVVKDWLEAKNLTWQKGYPSKSECPGQVGQLIPEMHDPLLNDPDVLK
ncbi:hypothetical protein [Cellvibrio japonicus]|uniref:Uncharacterized protein n=1 Tax=Cellvibrio japonicus (strain Ueda107) TaxID=498211 RepID=B3PKZ5_CELJU|nr:hypothetical protein [Cellvibrio japonicus]ACE85872.1 hypothetical protein CJA_2508 [Cellvibrio japonicus Ueda107]QEI12894.1 hypothetical protein FY117_12110 [Cellvibrio japonicus]QEI16468.1 hypothetical protein FY116_12115 [Cellvibrio japonicus]QEI20046.1 hypothetical protein FY115_12110 [Cellvibrio japonicus]